MLCAFCALFLSGSLPTWGLWARPQQRSWEALGTPWSPSRGAGGNSMWELHGKKHTLKFDKDQVKIAGSLLVFLFAFCWAHKLRARCALLFMPKSKSVCVCKREKKK